MVLQKQSYRNMHSSEEDEEEEDDDFEDTNLYRSPDSNKIISSSNNKIFQS